MNYYISSCVFTERFPELSERIRKYVINHYDMEIVRCCTPGWKVKIHEDRMPEGHLYDEWKNLPQSKVFIPEDEVWSLCPNCMNITEEWRGSRVHSLWERIDQDPDFPFPDYGGITVTIQDCWRMRDRTGTHDAIRSILKKMNIKCIELPKNRENADFCGTSLYRPQVSRNEKLAPKHYKEGCEGIFLEHTDEEQINLMKEYCMQYETDIVVCYCHYCLEGLLTGGTNGKHIAELLFI